MMFTEKELERLLISVFVLTFAFMFSFYNRAGIVIFMLSLAFTTLSYALREIAHFKTARDFGYHTEYNLWAPGAVITAVSSLFPLTFAVLGYVEVKSKYHDHIDKNLTDFGPFTLELSPGTREALISYIAVLMNLALGMIFLAFPLFDIWNFPLQAFKFGAFINLCLALFNLLPVEDLDGIRIITWRASIWIITLFSTLGLMVFLLWI